MGNPPGRQGRVQRPTGHDVSIPRFRMIGGNAKDRYFLGKLMNQACRSQDMGNKSLFIVDEMVRRKHGDDGIGAGLRDLHEREDHSRAGVAVFRLDKNAALRQCLQLISGQSEMVLIDNHPCVFDRGKVDEF